MKVKFICDTCGKEYETYEKRARKHHYCSKECLNNSPPTKDYTGQKINRLLVVEYIKTNIIKKRWRCVCECGNEVFTDSYSLGSNKIKSCGCYRKEKLLNQGYNNKKKNEYNLDGEYGIGFTSKGEEFYFDIEDYDLIKDICWNVSKRGYLTGKRFYKEKTIVMHRIVCGVVEDGKVIDHINRNKLDNRKHNLRECYQQENTFNCKLSKNNKTGYTGISLSSGNRYVARIKYNKKEIILGCFSELEDAIKARLQAELEYFGEFAPQKHLFEKYGITKGESSCQD